MKPGPKIIAPIFATALWLASCASLQGTDYQTYLDTGYAFYGAYCLSQPQSDYCTADAHQKAKDAYATAEKAIAAYNNGEIDATALKTAIKKAFKLFADFQG